MKLKKKQKKQLIELGAFTIITVVGVVCGVINKEDILEVFHGENIVEENTIEKEESSSVSGQIYEVLRVVDGDTIQIDYHGTKEKVRFIGIDTPESVHPNGEKNTEAGKIASNYTKELLTGKKVTLEFDVQERDKYGRLLAYVYLDGEMLNKKLLADGYAQVATFPPNVKYVDEFTKIQRQAKEEQRGLWAQK